MPAILSEATEWAMNVFGPYKREPRTAESVCAPLSTINNRAVWLRAKTDLYESSAGSAQIGSQPVEDIPEGSVFSQLQAIYRSLLALGKAEGTSRVSGPQIVVGQLGQKIELGGRLCDQLVGIADYLSHRTRVTDLKQDDNPNAWTPADTKASIVFCSIARKGANGAVIPIHIYAPKAPYDARRISISRRYWDLDPTWTDVWQGTQDLQQPVIAFDAAGNQSFFGAMGSATGNFGSELELIWHTVRSNIAGVGKWSAVRLANTYSP